MRSQEKGYGEREWAQLNPYSSMSRKLSTLREVAQVSLVLRLIMWTHAFLVFVARIPRPRLDSTWWVIRLVGTITAPVYVLSSLSMFKRYFWIEKKRQRKNKEKGKTIFWIIIYHKSEPRNDYTIKNIVTYKGKIHMYAHIYILYWISIYYVIIYYLIFNCLIVFPFLFILILQYVDSNRIITFS